SPSGPTIDTENTENLLHDICIFADVIEAIINDYYNIICLSNVMHQEKENKKENPDKKNLDILKLALDKLKKIIAMEVVLYLRSPLENDDAFDDPDIEIGLDTNRDNNDGDIGTRDLHNRKGKVHKEVRPEEIQYTLDDVAGIEEQKNQVTEILDFLEEPERFTKLGAEIPKGVLLSGPPGTGKTMLAQAIAKEANIPFFAMDGSAFVEIYVGVGAGRVRDLFNKAKKKAPSIVFIDEIDAIAGSRNASSGSSGEREQALNQLLAKMDGFEGNSGVIVMGATNRQDMLDSAILSRFNRQIVIPNPDIDAREAILKVHTRNKPLENDVDLRHLARGTNRFSGRDLKNILNEAALLAVRRKKEAISADEIKEAYNTVLMGSERKIKHMRKEDLLRTAYHEAGHALLYEIYPEIDSVTQITIVPRGLALGLTWHLSDEERYHTTKRELFCELQAQLGGRAAEMVIFGDDYVTTGASKDIKRSTNTVKNMIMKWGMSKELGIPYYGGGDYHENLGYRVGNDIQISPKTQQKIDTAVKDILENMLRKAVEQLNKHRKALEALTEALLLKKTLDGDEVRRIIKENPSTVVLPEPEEVEIKHYWHIMY
ncbi:MAG: AAA family ATPase, partial [Patescibacteria group bacterium]|nr:AAA family ATPase [Patescibacteria group bacterium]